MKHSHYHKDVSGLQSIDVYRVLRLFEVTDPCLQHAIKKLLVAGGRGVKDIAQDVQEAIDTLERWGAMWDEDQPGDRRGCPECGSIIDGICGFGNARPCAYNDFTDNFDEARIDIITQNGNDGLHYGQCLSCKRETCTCP